MEKYPDLGNRDLRAGINNAEHISDLELFWGKKYLNSLFVANPDPGSRINSVYP